MKAMSELLNGLIIGIGIILYAIVIGGSMYCVFHYGVDYKKRASERLEKHLNEEALNGNEFALKILRKTSSYDIKYKDKKIFEEALKGNPYALKILHIDNEEK